MTHIQELHSLHNEAVLISKNLQRQEFLMIEILQKIDHKKVYRFLGFKSLFQYATVALKLSESRAYTFILISRKAAKLSKFQESLKNGLSLSKAKRITSVITPDNEDHWINLAKTLSQRLLDRAVYTTNPKSSVEEGSRFISENVLEFRAAVSIETEILIKRVQDLLSQSRGQTISFDDTLKAMASTFLEKNDPVRKAQRMLAKKISSTNSQSEPTAPRQTKPRLSVPKNKSQNLLMRKPLSAHLKREIYLRDHGLCQQTGPINSSDNVPSSCGDGRWIDIHHIQPIHQGGENFLENLITLCKSHHQMQHNQRPELKT
jgi:hypothetical protein